MEIWEAGIRDSRLAALGPTNAAGERFGFSGSYGWHAEKGRVAHLPEPLVRVLSRTVDPQLCLRLESQFTSLGAPREEQSDGQTVWLMQGETASGTKATLTFDAKTGLLLAFDETRFRDYKDVEAGRLPFTVTIWAGSEARFDRIENNAPVQQAAYEAPE